jgi:phage tail sheath gpL-like
MEASETNTGLQQTLWLAQEVVRARVQAEKGFTSNSKAKVVTLYSEGKLLHLEAANASYSPFHGKNVTMKG